MTGSSDTLAQLRPLLAEIGDAKRVRIAGSDHSLAEQAFVRAWGRLVGGEDPAVVALSETAAALVRVRLAGVDGAVLLEAGLDEQEACSIVQRAFDEVAGPIDEQLTAQLRGALSLRRVAAPGPELAERLIGQPRAGATAPGKPRIIVEPFESHGDHCVTVALYGVLVAPEFGADPVTPFLMGMAHHLANVALPDAGFAGEVLLGSAYDRILARLEERELIRLPEALAERLREALRLRANAEAAESKAFHAADVLDRVLQVYHHARAAAFTADQALDDLELVHVGAVQSFQLDVLASAGLG